MNVIIVGAGISGLTLAAALAWSAPRIEVELFERDAAPAWRRGYAISLDEGDGLALY
jgi:2-polyprenyl-6-methoxyphenol hydroxylase-like FAD-dependent oxidoreductase